MIVTHLFKIYKSISYSRQKKSKKKQQKTKTKNKNKKKPLKIQLVHQQIHLNNYIYVRWTISEALANIHLLKWTLYSVNFILTFFFFFFFFFFFLIWVLRPFQEYFTYIEPIVYRRWAKTGVPGEKPPDHP